MTTKEDGIRLNKMGTLDRLKELLDHPIKYQDILLNNLNILFPVAEENAEFWDRISKDHKQKYPNLKDNNETFEDEAKEWSEVVRRCCFVLEIEPDKSKRIRWGISYLVGHTYTRNEHGKVDGCKGGTWVKPKRGFLTKVEAEAVMNQTLKAEIYNCILAKLPLPCEVVAIVPGVD